MNNDPGVLKSRRTSKKSDLNSIVFRMTGTMAIRRAQKALRSIVGVDFREVTAVVTPKRGPESEMRRRRNYSPRPDDQRTRHKRFT
ncbi:hypothetical protein AVEN_235070-1 [Araneus ventricosus]|uniref:Uncharacterized protein n=1 Tax=Araneus ventricosus TaxID=182803 RepID=A0A4Y2PZH7_ARAVE|nr:hypothetical protein AVEN_235070-1 [Araneus ventricosus]